MRLRIGANLNQTDKQTISNKVTSSVSGSPGDAPVPSRDAVPSGRGTGAQPDMSESPGTSLDGGTDSSLCQNSNHCARDAKMNVKSMASGGDELHNSNIAHFVGNAAADHVSGSHSTAGHARQRDILLPHDKCVVWGLKLFGFLLVLFYFAIPAFIKLYPAIIADVAFLNKIRWPPFINLEQPSELGLNYTCHLKLNSTDDVSLGTWHVLPEQLALDRALDLASDQYSSLLNSGNPVFLYLHGNAGTRAGWHRMQLYKVLSKAGFHVVTFDYRGYADSSGSPSEEGLVQDSVTVFKWIKKNTDNVPIYIWGHSLGSGVATKTASRLCQEGAVFNGLVLEAPFNNFIEAASNYPLSLPFRAMPWFSWVFIEALKLNGIRFASDENIQSVTVPVMILHAIDDGLVPYELGRKLYEAALRRTVDSSVEFVTFDAGYGHKHIHKSPQLVDVVRKFTSAHNANKQKPL